MLTLLLLQTALAQSPDHLLENDALLANPRQLTLVPSRTSTVYRAQQGEWQFNLHSYVTFYDNKFWAIWSSGRVDEDSATQVIRYATSTDGHTWSEGKILADDPDGTTGPKRWIARGIFVLDGKLQALNALNEGPRETPEGRESWQNLQLIRFEWDGATWRNRGVYLPNCMNNYPPRRAAGHLVMTCRDSFARMHTAYTTSAGKWVVTKLPGAPPHDKMSEPSWYADPRGTLHMIFRDGGRSKRLYRSLSRDNGITWSAPVRTNYPDATSKNIGARLSNGWYFLINNPNTTSRDPLSISFSEDGWTYSRPAALRLNAPDQRYPGRSKGNKSFQYPHAFEHNGSLWVIYSTNKEDIEISEYKLADFHLPVHKIANLYRDSGSMPDAKVETHSVFKGQPGESGFNLHSYLAYHDGRFWAIWSSAKVHEEDPDQHIRYSTSRDGRTWSAPQTLAADPDGPSGPARWIARGIFLENGKLTALGAYIESADYKKRGQQVVWKNLKLMRFVWSNNAWQPAGLYANNCMNNFPPERLGGQLALICRDSNMDVYMALADSPGANNWKGTPIAAEPPFNQMDEPTYYATRNGEVHLIIRDNSRSGYVLRAISYDNGKTFTQPVRTNYPDATSKNFTGKLSTGAYFLINNPNQQRRDPLAISFSKDGWQFSNPLVIRRGGGSFQYPHAIEHNGKLWIIYSTNKRDIDLAEMELPK